MSFLRRRAKRVPGEYPETFTRAWVRLTLPTASEAEAQSTVQHLRGKGWSEEKLARYVLPFMPREDELEQTWLASRRPREETVALPAQLSQAWLDEQLPAMSPRQIGLVVEQLEGRGLSPREAAVAVLPHLLPKLEPDDVQAILAGLPGLGLSDEEIARLTRCC